jgi:hypothetical protein
MIKVIMLFTIMNSHGSVIHESEKFFPLDFQTCIEAIPGTKQYLQNYSRVYAGEIIDVRIDCRQVQD